MSWFESNFINPFWDVSWFESIVKTLWFMSWVESKLSETELNRINFSSLTHVFFQDISGNFQANIRTFKAKKSPSYQMRVLSGDQKVLLGGKRAHQANTMPSQSNRWPFLAWKGPYSAAKGHSSANRSLSDRHVKISNHHKDLLGKEHLFYYNRALSDRKEHFRSNKVPPKSTQGLIRLTECHSREKEGLCQLDRALCRLRRALSGWQGLFRVNTSPSQADGGAF